MRGKARLLAVSVVTCLVLAGVWAVLIVPGPALAGKPDKPPPGQDNDGLMVEVFDGADEGPPFEPNSPAWAPTSLDADCVTKTVGSGGAKYHFHFYQDLRATLVTSAGVELKDDVGCSVYLDRKGRVNGLRVRGQDVAGPDGIMHVSEVLPIDPPVAPPPDGEAFVLHVHQDDIPIYRTDSHTMRKKTKLVERVGTISIGDIVYSPLPAP